VNLYAYVENNPIRFVDLMGTEKKATAEQFRIDFVKAYDEFLIAQDSLNKAQMNLNVSYKAPMIFWKKDYINRMQNNYNNVLNDYNIKENIAKELHYSRNNHNNITVTGIQNAIDSWWEEPKLRWSTFLANAFHQDILSFNFNWIERKFISPDWHSEVVYYKNWTQVTDRKYYWTYNIYSPVTDKDSHTKYDVDPYLKWWN
jgi:hypothetical protein